MSKPIFIDPLSFTRDGGSLSGEVAVAELDGRALDGLADSSGSLAYSLVGYIDALRRPVLELKVTGSLKVECPRCLVPKQHQLDAHAVLTLFTSEDRLEAAEASDDTLEGVLIEEPELSVWALIEDEILMELPFVPPHDSCGDGEIEKTKNDKPNPFAVLADLKKTRS